ncbi:MAG: DUF1822 family protein [Scytonematopsis contorta HA4267-MV1]|jgi:hypothetical protein|nr:DUF1822 family protein [Scytonematopsis contorta HA4267-MV1]
MSKTTYELEDFALPLPITQAARQKAQEFANQQPTPERSEQVLLNTLCVWVVNDYLKMMGISTDLLKSDSWNPVLQMFANTADLDLPGVGRLECRPVHENSQNCLVPPETWEERVGYVVVQIDASLEEAKLLGFVRNIKSEELPLNQLQSPEALIEYLYHLCHSPVKETLVNLGQWLNGLFETGWETLESLWNQPELRPAYAFRGGENLVEKPTSNAENAIRRAKLINLGIQVANQTAILIIEISPQLNGQTSIRLQLHPTGTSVYLPEGVKLTIVDGSGAVFLEAEARSADNYVQLQLSGETGESFGIQVSLDGASVTENVVI